MIKGLDGKLKLDVDVNKRVCYEAPIGLWDKDDYAKYHNGYVTEVVPKFGGKSWAKCSDLRNYKTSSISDAMNEHAEWIVNNGLTHCAFVVESAIVKMQMNRATGGRMKQQAFTDLDEAKAWLKSQGF